MSALLTTKVTSCVFPTSSDTLWVDQSTSSKMRVKMCGRGEDQEGVPLMSSTGRDQRGPGDAMRQNTRDARNVVLGEKKTRNILCKRTLGGHRGGWEAEGKYCRCYVGSERPSRRRWKCEQMR